MKQTPRRDPNLAIGGLMMALFGAVWLWAWNYFSNGWSWIAAAAILIGWLGLSARAGHVLRRRLQLPPLYTDAERATTSKRIGKVNMWQWLAIGAAVLLLNVLHKPTYIPYAVVVIVGLHFLPLAKALNCPEYFVSGLCMAAVGLLACGATLGGHDASMATAVTGLLLWGTTLAVIRVG